MAGWIRTGLNLSRRHKMNARRCLLGAVILVAWPATAREKTDVLVMRNGDRLTCEIKGLSADALYISLDYALGTLSMPKTEGARPVSIEVTEPDGGSVELERNQVAKMDQSFENFWHRFNGDVGLGAIYSKGNQSTQYSLATDLDYPRDRWAASVSYNSALSSNK